MRFKRNNSLFFLLGAFLTSIGYLFGLSQKPQISPISPITPIPQILQASNSAGLVKVTRIIDGDTVEIETGQKVRYIGINAPESVTPGKPVGCYGREASDKNKELVEGKEVRLEKDISETDRYGRVLRYVYVGDVFVNDNLVRSGYAQVSTYPPDVKYQDQFRQSEKYARENNLGLWNKCQN